MLNEKLWSKKGKYMFKQILLVALILSTLPLQADYFASRHLRHPTKNLDVYLLYDVHKSLALPTDSGTYTTPNCTKQHNDLVTIIKTNKNIYLLNEEQDINNVAEGTLLSGLRSNGQPYYVQDNITPMLKMSTDLGCKFTPFAAIKPIPATCSYYTNVQMRNTPKSRQSSEDVDEAIMTFITQDYISYYGLSTVIVSVGASHACNVAKDLITQHHFITDDLVINNALVTAKKVNADLNNQLQACEQSDSKQLQKNMLTKNLGEGLYQLLAHPLDLLEIFAAQIDPTNLLSAAIKKGNVEHATSALASHKATVTPAMIAQARKLETETKEIIKNYEEIVQLLQ
jgi:hypothetical protein